MLTRNRPLFGPGRAEQRLEAAYRDGDNGAALLWRSVAGVDADRIDPIDADPEAGGMPFTRANRLSSSSI